MTREEYIEDIKISLGCPIVEIEIESILGKLVDKAFREVSRFITLTRFVTVPYSANGIDTTPYRINSVIQLFRVRNAARITDIADVYSLGAINPSYATVSSTNTYLSDYYYRTQLAQLKATMSTDLDWTFDKPMLYVSTYYPRPEKITIAYIPEFKDVSEITEQYWINYIQRLALAFSKESLGRVRDKYNLSSALYTLDGDKLLSEGIAERDAVRQELQENSDIVFPMD